MINSVQVQSSNSPVFVSMPSAYIKGIIFESSYADGVLFRLETSSFSMAVPIYEMQSPYITFPVQLFTPSDFNVRFEVADGSYTVHIDYEPIDATVTSQFIDISTTTNFSYSTGTHLVKSVIYSNDNPFVNTVRILGTYVSVAPSLFMLANNIDRSVDSSQVFRVESPQQNFSAKMIISSILREI